MKIESNKCKNIIKISLTTEHFVQKGDAGRREICSTGLLKGVFQPKTLKHKYFGTIRGSVYETYVALASIKITVCIIFQIYVPYHHVSCPPSGQDQGQYC